jgi:hypothetical protein
LHSKVSVAQAEHSIEFLIFIDDNADLMRGNPEASGASGGPIWRLQSITSQVGLIQDKGRRCDPGKPAAANGPRCDSIGGCAGACVDGSRGFTAGRSQCRH